MALDFENQQSASRRKRKRTKRDLSPNEKVEVRSEEDGFQGSWHPGTVIAFSRQGLDLKYEVKYNHILTADESDYLVDQVCVSLPVDDTDCANANRCNYRGLIRPAPPTFQFGKYGLPYGMCVDVHYQEAWWEGVIFDHEDGSEERKVFFPDLGDEMMASISKVRITQDWNEVDETWGQRGTWLFLVVIEEYEQKQYIPVSIKQLWYDMREKDSFEKLGEWTSTVKALWRDLVLEAIDDNLKLVVNHLLQVIGIPEATQQALQIAKPVNDVNMHWKEGLVETHDIITVENSPNDDLLLNPSCPDVESTLDGLVPKFSCDDKPAVCMQPQTFFTLPSNLDGIPVLSSIISDEGFSNSNSNKLNWSSSGSTCFQRGWLPAGSDIVPGPEFCPDAIIKYAQMGDERPRSTLINDVRKHLLHQKWKIEFMRDKGMPRLRYTSPDGKLYYSLRQVCLNFSETDRGILSTPSEGKQSSLHTSRGDSSSHIEQPPENWDPYCSSKAVSSSNSEVVVYEPEYCPEAIVEWCNRWCKHGSGKRSWGKLKKADMALRARKHLAALGWVFGRKTFNGRSLLYHRSPMGRTYWSLRQAIKDNLDEGADISRDMETENVSDIVEGQFSCEKLSSAICRMDIQKLKNCSKESFHISQSRKHHELYKINVQTTRKARRKRKDGLHVETHSDAQNTSCPKSISRIPSGVSIKLQNDKKHTKRVRVLRSSKRVQRVVAPDPSHHKPRTVLSWLIDNNIVLPRTKVHYGSRKDRDRAVEGRITRSGIKCSCCGKVYTLSGFELHAGSKSGTSATSKYCKPAASIFLDDGRSLLECQRQMMHDEKMNNRKAKTPYILKRSWDQDENDNDVPGIMEQMNGSIILKKIGFAAKNAKRLVYGFLETPKAEFMLMASESAGFVLHIAGFDSILDEAEESIFLGLQKLLGKPIPVGVDNLTWTLFKSMQSDNHKLDDYDDETLVETYSKLNIALDVMHECFEPVEESCTRRDLMQDVIFSIGSELNRLNFQGFYTILLEKNDELVTVATVRIYGDNVAEIPLVGTRFQYRRLGMCRILMDVLEKKLMELGVQRLVLPAVPGVLSTWTGSFGFSKMKDSERLQFLDYTFLDFQDTVMCQKPLMKLPSAQTSPSKEIQPTVLDYVYGSGKSIGVNGSSPVSEVLQTDQNEDGGIMEQGPVDVAASSTSDGIKRPVHQAVVVNQPNHPECEPCNSKINESSVEGSAFKKEGRVGDSGSSILKRERLFSKVGNLKCYQRRKTLARQN
ncbi:unnamed protein product [Dovyalis caffra]|uniref:N-acetyltransferase domain-containing protein n=1 Tax=Dovyalis caffra TaxID=77055 RepID=A0AAV1RB83_9ROSI|nr:unnamed protein product [Dovyalis caffra]